MKPIHRVKELQKQIKVATKEIAKIQKACKHTRVLHKEGPDIYAGWSTSERCLECGKSMGCSTRMTDAKDKAHTKIIRKEG